MTVKEFIEKTPDSYQELAVCEYKESKLNRKYVCEKHNWSCEDIPEDILDKEVEKIIPYFDRIVLQVDAGDGRKEFSLRVTLCEGQKCGGTLSIVSTDEDSAINRGFNYVSSVLAEALPMLDIPISLEIAVEKSDYKEMSYEKFMNLQAGDIVYIKTGGQFIKSIVTDKTRYNADADEPGMEVETNNGFCDQSSLYIRVDF